SQGQPEWFGYFFGASGGCDWRHHLDQGDLRTAPHGGALRAGDHVHWRWPGHCRDFRARVTQRSIRSMNMTVTKVGVIGAGTMGNGIAQVCASAGLAVVMQDISEAALERGLNTIRTSLARLVGKQLISEEQKNAILARIQTRTDIQAFADVDLVIEAATEAEGLKLQILKNVSEVVSEGAVIATNTSSLSVTKLAAATLRPEQFIGLHFFNPVPVMALVEVIAGLQTSAATRERAEAFVKSIN